MASKKPKQELVTGHNCLTVPCEPASEKERAAPRPVYCGPLWYPQVYICPRCGRRGSTYHSIEAHMGLIPNVMGDCRGPF